MAKAGAPAGATGGAEARWKSVPGMAPTRFGSPWQTVQELVAASAFPSRWAPVATLMAPSGFTVSAWQALQDRASAPAASGGWPVGGMPWHEVHVSGVPRSFQFIDVLEPFTPLKLKLPWQATLLQVLVAGSKVAPAAATIGFWEKSTAKPVGAWQSEQVSPAENTPPWRCGVWMVPEGTGPVALGLEVPLAHPARTVAVSSRARRCLEWGARMARPYSHSIVGPPGKRDAMRQQMIFFK